MAHARPRSTVSGARLVGFGRPRWSTRSRSAHHVTRPSASTTMKLDIFDEPRSRLPKAMGTSTIRPWLHATA